MTESQPASARKQTEALQTSKLAWYDLSAIGSVTYVARKMEELLCDLMNSFYLDNLDFTRNLITDKSLRDNFDCFRTVVDYALHQTSPTDEEWDKVSEYFLVRTNAHLVKKVKAASVLIREDYKTYMSSQKPQNAQLSNQEVLVKDYVEKVNYKKPISEEAMNASGRKKILLMTRDRLKAIKTSNVLGKRLIMLITREILAKGMLEEPKLPLGGYIRKVFESTTQTAQKSVGDSIAEKMCQEAKFMDEIVKTLGEMTKIGHGGLTDEALRNRIKATELYKVVSTEKFDAGYDVDKWCTAVAGEIRTKSSHLDELLKAFSIDTSHKTLNQQEIMKIWKSSSLAQALKEKATQTAQVT